MENDNYVVELKNINDEILKLDKSEIYQRIDLFPLISIKSIIILQTNINSKY